MSGDTFGRLFRLTTFGESHGRGLGGVVEGCPAGVPLSEEAIQEKLDKRKPGQPGGASTTRKEPDRVQLYSGVFEGATTGTAIGFLIENTDQRSRDYSKVKDIYRPGHADITFDAKYGVRDYRGGGRSSARETVSRVAGGAVAQAFLAGLGVSLRAFPVELGGVAAPAFSEADLAGAPDRPFFAPHPNAVEMWQERVAEVKKDGDSIGGIVQVEIHGMPAGLGEPVFDKLDARLAYAFMGVGAVKGVEIGSGFSAARSTGSANNDPLAPVGMAQQSNNAGGILGGISDGRPVVARVAVKPIPSIFKEQRTVNRSGEAETISMGGRHDVSAIPRIVPVLEAMASLVAADFVLLQRRMGFRT